MKVWVRGLGSVGVCALVSLAIAGCAVAGDPGDDVFETREQAVTYCVGQNKVEGIDVSFWQGASINWPQVRASGKRFAFLRLSYGAQGGIDSTFRRNWTEAKAAGILRGAYQYFLPAQDAATQANLLVNEIGVLGAGDLPAVIDVEQTPNGITPASYAQKVATWVDIVERGTGKKPIIYTGKYFWNDNVQSSAFRNNPLWLAAYVSGCPDTPNPWTKWTFWQYSDQGSASGISGNVDVNVFDGTYAELEALAGVTACVPATEVCNGRDDDCDGQSDEGDVCELDFAARHAAALAPATTTDVDGDGLADVCGRGATGIVCKLANASGFASGPDTIPWSNAGGFDADNVHETLRAGDVNGDGRADFCMRSATGVVCQVSKPSGGWASISGPGWSNAVGWGAAKYAQTIRLADLDGDGRDDLCARAAKGIVCHLATGAGFGPEIAGPAWSDANGFDRPRTWSTLALADVDGDGKRDVCIRSADGIRCARFDGATFGPEFDGPAWTDDAGWGDVKYFASVRFADVDGDRRADACARGVAGLRCALATGSGFGPEISANVLKDVDGWGGEKYRATLRVADVNGDGKSELCARAAAGLRCFGFADGAFTQVLSSTVLSDADGWGVSGVYETIAFGDVNGDGKADPCARGTDGYECWESTGTGTTGDRTVAEYGNTQGWDDPLYFASLRLAGPSAKRVAPTTDAGVGATDAGSPPGDAGTAAAITSDSSGCGCRVVGPAHERSSRAAIVIGGGLMLLTRARRRRRG
jgi:GH25 family lysozyme M1 (1,4-beta-N-acetylmuramidase)